MVHVVRRDMIQGTSQLENQLGGYFTGFHNIRVPVLGEVALTMRYGSKLVDLPRMKVVKESVYDLILRSEWIRKSYIIIFTVDEQLIALVRNPTVDFVLRALIADTLFIRRRTTIVAINNNRRGS